MWLTLIADFLPKLVLNAAGGIAKEAGELRSDRWAFAIAMTYAWHGDPDTAFEWLDTAYDQRDPS